MDWARDHMGNDVPAGRGSIPAFGLVCPSCGAPVRRRDGGKREAHFAHVSGRAKPVCDKYFPPPPVSRLPAAVAAPVGHLHRESLRCGLFLIYQEELGSPALRPRKPPAYFARTHTPTPQIHSILNQ